MATVINQEQRSRRNHKRRQRKIYGGTNPLALTIRVWLHQTNEILSELFQAR
jgi:hypothetical protein